MVGSNVGAWLGAPVGSGLTVGEGLGLLDRRFVGGAVGSRVGAELGDPVGALDPAGRVKLGTRSRPSASGRSASQAQVTFPASTALTAQESPSHASPSQARQRGTSEAQK
jgi:hypothetical protein